MLGVFRNSIEASVKPSELGWGWRLRTKRIFWIQQKLYQGRVGLGFHSKRAGKPLESLKRGVDQIYILRFFQLPYREQTAGGARVQQEDQ